VLGWLPGWIDVLNTSEYFGAGRNVPKLIVVLFPGYSDITKLRQQSKILTENRMDSSKSKKFQSFLRLLLLLKFFVRLHAIRDPLRGELPHVQNFMNDGPNPLK
jgi:hypothetical protein